MSYCSIRTSIQVHTSTHWPCRRSKLHVTLFSTEDEHEREARSSAASAASVKREHHVSGKDRRHPPKYARQHAHVQSGKEKASLIVKKTGT